MKTGARALRSILEKSMLDVAFTLPQMDGIHRLIFTKEIMETSSFPICE
jgi:ATP-dependent protease Clp ATPase subunit